MYKNPRMKSDNDLISVSLEMRREREKRERRWHARFHTASPAIAPSPAAAKKADVK